ncbi:SEC-C metal-binding domain-containing protein [Anaeromicropila populeti]|uniref:SEC-C motif-containing protein n=1 Tax=Anaeromicropila populeti TaxID=37658 RepID=A0A1I6IEK2_9FIRM|nr:SEC-C metal-binding domain-containing protein [Anaeromicropila populeti]SFR65195.1 SEC-C motif-containing protein [Anaeromicropila populeti]
MQLREKLEYSTKQELLDQARSFELKKCSRLRKEQLIDRIVTCFCSEEMLRSRLACLTKEQMDLYRKACISPTAVSVNQVMDAIQLNRYWLGYFEEPTDNLCVFDDVADAFRKIDDEAFKKENSRKGWMMKCVCFFINYYGIAPVEVIYEMYKQKIKCSLDEMVSILEGMPMDIIESCIFSMDMIGIQDWPMDSPLYSKNGLLIHIPLLESKEFGYLLRQQAEKDFFVPSEKIIDEICRSGYEVSSLAYQKLESFIRKRFSLNYEQAVSLCLQIWANSYDGNSPTDILNHLSEANISFSSDKILNEFVGLLMNAYNSTRLKENRGHKPDELSKDVFKGGMPTIVPASSNAAAMLREAEPQLHAMGFPVDVNGGADTIQTSFYPNGLNGQAVNMEKKIYPNDPCPCGSGKKYKKCCGKFK